MTIRPGLFRGISSPHGSTGIALIEFALRLDFPFATRNPSRQIERPAGPCRTDDIARSNALMMHCGDTLPVITERHK